MAGRSKVDIFNIMTKEELDDKLQNSENSVREYQRLVAMKGISIGLKHKDVAELIGVSPRTISRWANSCQNEGLKGLMPNFNGGRTPRLTIRQKLEFGNILYLNEGLSMLEARQILIDDFNEKFCLSQVMNIVEDLGFEYTRPRPEFIESPEDKEQILKDRIKAAEITDEDLVGGLDESTMKTGIGIKKGIHLRENGKKKREKITGETVSLNFMCFLGYNCESYQFVIKRLNEYEFCKSLLKLRSFLCDSKEIKNTLETIIDNFDLSNKEIRKILEDKNESPKEFLEKIERSIKANKKDPLPAIARKLEKHCKRESTENNDKRKTVKEEHVKNILLTNNIKEICHDMPRLVLFMDNAKAHQTDLVEYVVEILNIYIVFLPLRSPEFAPVEFVFKLEKEELKSNLLTTEKEVFDCCMNTFETKCKDESIYQWFVDLYLT